MNKNNIKTISLIITGLGVLSLSGSLDYSREMLPPPFSVSESTNIDDIDEYNALFDYECLNSDTSDEDLNKSESSTDSFVNNLFIHISELVDSIFENPNNERKLVEFVKENQTNFLFSCAIERFFGNKNADEKLCFLETIISSEISILTNWYKNALLIASTDSDYSLSFFANDVLSYYKEDFDLI